MLLVRTALLATLLTFPLSAKMAEPTPTSMSFPKAVFTDPSTIFAGNSDLTIRNDLIEMIDAATQGSSVRFMVYLINDTQLQDSLKAAYRRGVHVHVVLDWSANGSGRTSNRHAYDDLKGNVTSVTKVANSMGIVHNKFALFSEVATDDGNAKSIIFSTSSNFKASSYKKYQDALVIQDETLFTSGFVRYWDYILANNSSRGLKKYNYRNQKGSVKLNNGRAMHKAYFFPKRKNGGDYGYDTAALILGHVITGSEDSQGRGANIRLAMSLWSESRNRNENPSVLDQIRTLANNNANTIEVIIPNKSLNQKTIQQLRELADKDNVTIRVIKENLHSKYLLVDADYGQQGRQKIVFSGAQNFTHPALRKNFETWIKYIADEATGNLEIFETYSQNFDEVTDFSTPIAAAASLRLPVMYLEDLEERGIGGR